MSKIVKWGLYFLVFLVVVSFIRGCFSQPESVELINSKQVSEQPTTSSANIQDNSQAVASEDLETANWVYDESVDEMRGESSYFATNASLNTVDLGFPYGTDISLNIILRSDPKNGNDIMFIVDRGQLFCSYRDCSIAAKFDDGDVQTYEASEAEAGSSEVLFLSNNVSSFAKKIHQSSRLMIEVNFYDHGAEQFKFDVSGLEWSKF